MDWVSSYLYSGEWAVPAGQNRLIQLMQTPDAANYDPSAYAGGNVEINAADFVVLRVVGTVHTQSDEEVASWWVAFRLMALPWDIGNDQFDAPWLNTDPILRSALNTDVVRWWAERYYYVQGIGTGEPAGITPVEIPWYTNVDVEPKARMGLDKQLYPVMVADNTMNPFPVRYILRLRLLLKMRYSSG